MAEGANLRQNLQNFPSIFEISAAETLDDLIYPALSKVFDYFGLNFALFKNNHIREDFSPIVCWALQYLYLRNRGSSFGESFYGLQRTASETGEVLTRSKQFTSATLLTLLPYIENKLKKRSTLHLTSSPWERHFLNIFHAYRASKAIHTFLYLIKYTTSHSPIFRALKLSLRYPVEPIKEDKATDIALKLLEVFAFFLQFIQWWYSTDQRRKLGGTLKNPEAIDDESTGDAPQEFSETKKGQCPVCLMSIETPTACAISGYVYCWKCIVNHLKTQKTCPVTGYAITLDDLVRIYEN